MSTTSMAMSARFPPRFLMLVKAACPGVSRMMNPGIFISIFNAWSSFPLIFLTTSNGIWEQPMHCVILPGSDWTIAVLLIVSRSWVFPASTLPMTVTISCLSIRLKKDIPFLNVCAIRRFLIATGFVSSMETVNEGLAKIKVQKPKIVSKEMKVFYNPVMSMNRDISVLLLNSINKSNMQIADPLAASGIRSIRFLKELYRNKIKKIYINDNNRSAVKLIKKNLKLNDIKIKNGIIISNKDANLFILNST